MAWGRSRRIETAACVECRKLRELCRLERRRPARAPLQPPFADP